VGLEIKRRDQVTWGIVVPCPEVLLYSQRQKTDRSSTDVSTEAEEQFYLPAVASVSTGRLLCDHQQFQAISAACFLFLFRQYSCPALPSPSFFPCQLRHCYVVSSVWLSTTVHLDCTPPLSSTISFFISLSNSLLFNNK
jgi:hypothetical protein